MKNFCWFVTGTDTNVGKTTASRIILKIASKKKLSTIGFKPISSGSKLTSSGLRNNDALILQKSSNVYISYKKTNPYFVHNNIPPHLEDKKFYITLDTLSKKLRELRKKANLIIIEGAGGWYSPLNNTNTYADWIKKEKLPVILVVSIKIGCINHALLTYKAISYSGLKCLGWIANFSSRNKRFMLKYYYSLKNFLPLSCLGIIPYCKNFNKIDNLNIHLKLPFK